MYHSSFKIGFMELIIGTRPAHDMVVGSIHQLGTIISAYVSQGVIFLANVLKYLKLTNQNMDYSCIYVYQNRKTSSKLEEIGYRQHTTQSQHSATILH